MRATDTFSFRSFEKIWIIFTPDESAGILIHFVIQRHITKVCHRQKTGNIGIIHQEPVPKSVDLEGIYLPMKEPGDLVPPVPLTFYGFRIMVILGCYFIALFAGLLIAEKWIPQWRVWKWAQWIVVLTVPLAWLASQSGWVVAEVGRQPWSIQGLLPNVAAISRLETGAVQTTFIIFAVLFTLLLVAEISIMAKAIAAGPENE